MGQHKKKKPLNFEEDPNQERDKHHFHQHFELEHLALAEFSRR